jgi:hypothetical protein
MINNQIYLGVWLRLRRFFVQAVPALLFQLNRIGIGGYLCNYVNVAAPASFADGLTALETLSA